MMAAPAYQNPNTIGRRPNSRKACPICESTKSTQGCYWREDSTGRWVMAYCKTPSDKRATNSPVPGQYIHINKDGHTFIDGMAQLNRRIEQEKTEKPLTPLQLDEIYRYFLAITPLSEKHRTYLQAEGVSSFLCSSLYYSQAGRLAKELLRQFPKTATRHPLIKQIEGKDGRKWWTIAAAADGLLYPATNVDGLILGIQIRKDKLRGPKDNKYHWLSSEGRSGTPLTVFTAQPEAERAHMSIITEGYKKAYHANREWGCNVISVAGVSGYAESELIRTLKKLKTTVVVVAFDQDKRQNPKVKEEERKLLNRVAAGCPGTTIFTLEWQAELGKGLDDALKAGAEFEFKPAGPRHVENIEPEEIARTFGKKRKLYSLEKARRLHRAMFDRLVTRASHEQICLTSPTGTGKSRAADDSLAHNVMSGRLSGRWLLLTPNKANIAERTQLGSLLYQAIQPGLVAIQQGRNPVDLSQPYTPTPFDCANPAAQDAGVARQIAAKVVCGECPFGSADNWDKAYPGQPRPFECEVTGYIASRRVSEAAPVVIATKEAFLNNSDMAEGFDGIICDEDLLPHLYEIIYYGSETFTGWRESISLKNLAAPAWERLMAIIELAFNDLATRENLPVMEWLTEARPLLQEAATQLYEDLDNLIYECGLYGKNKDGAFDFERPYDHNSKRRFPFKGGAELLDALSGYIGKVYFARCPDKSYTLKVYAPRAALVNTLREKKLFVLDATLPPALKIYFPKLKEVKFEVPQNIQIFQITDAAYTKRNLFNPATRSRVGKGIGAFADGKEKHLTIIPQQFESGPEAMPLPENSLVTHWGLHKATNQYSDCDGLTLVGHFMRPIDHIKAELLTARSFVGKPAPKTNGPDKVLRLYNSIDPLTGKGAGRWMQADPDPEIQAAIDHDYQANIIQAIGRLRAACRPWTLPPVQVAILCNEPVGDLEINQLLTMDEIITNPPKTTTFIDNVFMKKGENGGVVPAYPTVSSGNAMLDAELDQDETRETQCFTLEEVARLSGFVGWEELEE